MDPIGITESQVKYMRMINLANESGGNAIGSWKHVHRHVGLDPLSGGEVDHIISTDIAASMILDILLLQEDCRAHTCSEPAAFM